MSTSAASGGSPASQTMLINAKGQVRVAIVDERSTVTDYFAEYPGQEQKKGNIYLGHVANVESSLDAAFVNYGEPQDGFLPIKEVDPGLFPEQLEADQEDIQIRNLLQKGMPLLVQIEKEERGNKGAALTTFITLTSCYLVLVPNDPRKGGISRQIEGKARDELHRLIPLIKQEIPEVQNMGLIFRTASAERTLEELKADLVSLIQEWKRITQAAKERKGPCCLHEESDIILCSVRDHMRPGVKCVWVDEKQAYEKLRNYVQTLRPDAVEKIRLHTSSAPLFTAHGIDRQVENAYKREIRLKSGGIVVIDRTEAMWGIDVNSAQSTRGDNIENTAYATNLEAVDEIARQLRIRDLGGLVAIDFIDMSLQKHQRDVEEALDAALKHDKARLQVGRLSKFGVLLMSRQRLRSSLVEMNHLPCPYCQGHGSIRTIPSLGWSIVHQIETMLYRRPGHVISVTVPVSVAAFLFNEERDRIQEMERNYTSHVVIVPSQSLEVPSYHIDVLENKRSVKQPTHASDLRPSWQINQWIARMRREASQAAPQRASVWQRLWDSLFQKKAQPHPEVKAPTHTGRTRKSAQRGTVSDLSTLTSGSSNTHLKQSPKKDHRKRSPARKKPAQLASSPRGTSQALSKTPDRAATTPAQPDPAGKQTADTPNPKAAPSKSVKKQDTKQGTSQSDAKPEKSHRHSDHHKSRRKPQDHRASHRRKATAQTKTSSSMDSEDSNQETR